jgi:predicted O-methyltransferase YrrM
MKKEIITLLSKLEKEREIYWNITQKLGQFLNLLIKNRNYKEVLEIGSSNGYSGIWLAEALSHTGGKLTTIESNQKKRFHLATENFEKSGLSKYIKQIAGHAPEAIPETDHFDMAFFDATKHEHLSYFEKIKTRINSGGMIITDNISSHEEQLNDYVEAIKKDPQWSSVKLNIGTGILISIRS